MRPRVLGRLGLALLALRLAACSGGGGGKGASPGTGGGRDAPPGTGGRGATPADAATPGVGGRRATEADAAATDGALDLATARDAGGGDLAGWTLVWSDEFDQDGAPSVANWRFENGFVRNMELQWYQAANASVANGVLTIEGRREQVSNPNYQAGSTDWKRNRQVAAYTSSSMTTSGRHSFTYGRFEARARIDVRQGSWPAFWMVGTTGGWPAGGEVDIMEFYAGTVLANVCLPARTTCEWSSIRQPVTRLGGAAWASQFHVWVMEWNTQTIDLLLDGGVVNHFNVADAVPAGTTNPYLGRPFYVILNLALGGTNGGDPTPTAFPMKYEVDYVRVYQRAP